MVPMPEERDRIRLGKLVRQRRTELDLNQDQIAELGGPSPDTVVRFERGKIGSKPQPRTLEGLDTALRWRPGSSKRVLEGGDPVAIDHPRDLETSRRLNEVMAQAGGHSWTPIQRRSIEDLANAAHKLVILCQLDSHDPGICEMARRIHLLAADMMTTAIASERGDNELLDLLEASNAGHARRDKMAREGEQS